VGSRCTRNRTSPSAEPRLAEALVERVEGPVGALEGEHRVERLDPLPRLGGVRVLDHVSLRVDALWADVVRVDPEGGRLPVVAVAC
jgi:hypothetical protein